MCSNLTDKTVRAVAPSTLSSVLPGRGRSSKLTDVAVARNCADLTQAQGGGYYSSRAANCAPTFQSSILQSARNSQSCRKVLRGACGPPSCVVGCTMHDPNCDEFVAVANCRAWQQPRRRLLSPRQLGVGLARDVRRAVPHRTGDFDPSLTAGARTGNLQSGRPPEITPQPNPRPITFKASHVRVVFPQRSWQIVADLMWRLVQRTSSFERPRPGDVDERPDGTCCCPADTCSAHGGPMRTVGIRRTS